MYISLQIEIHVLCTCLSPIYIPHFLKKKKKKEKKTSFHIEILNIFRLALKEISIYIILCILMDALFWQNLLWRALGSCSGFISCSTSGFPYHWLTRQMENTLSQACRFQLKIVLPCDWSQVKYELYFTKFITG